MRFVAWPLFREVVPKACAQPRIWKLYARLKDNIEEIWGQDCIWCPSIDVPRPVIQGIQTDFRKVLKYGRSVTSVVNDAYLS